MIGSTRVQLVPTEISSIFDVIAGLRIVSNKNDFVCWA